MTSIKVMHEDPISIYPSSLNYLYSRATLYVPSGSKTAYQAANYWKEFTNIEEFVKKDQTLDFAGIPTMTYGDATYNLPVETKEGLALTWTVANTDIAIISSNVLTINKAGTTTVTASNEGNENNAPYSQSYTLTVNKAPLTITAINKSMEYGDAVPAYELNYSGFVNNETSSVLTTQPTITCSARTTSNAGLYNIVLSAATASNYDITLVNGTMTINKAPLTITANSYTINMKDDLPEFGVTYSGFKNSETSSVLTTLPTITCDATDSETAGDFDIIPSGAVAANYSFNYVSGTLTIDDVTSVSITLNSLGKGTYCSKYPIDFTNVSGIEAYIISGFDPSAGKLIRTRVYEVPERTGLFIIGTPGATYNIPVKETDFYYANMMKGITVAKVIPTYEDNCTNFILASNGNGGVYFTRSNGVGTTAANRAYVQIPTSIAGARGFLDIEDDDSTTGLNRVFTPDTKEAEAVYYNLSGQKVQKPQKGIYIKNGKKIIIH